MLNGGLKKAFATLAIITLIVTCSVIRYAEASPGGEIIWVRTSNPTAYTDLAYGVAVDGTGVYIVGSDMAETQGWLEWRIEKRSLTDGALIWNQTNNPSPYNDEALDVAVDDSGIYVVGYAYSEITGHSEWRIEKRSLTTGSLLWQQTSHLGVYDERAYGVAVDSTGVYIVGSDTSSADEGWRIEKRSLTDGALVWNQTSNPSTLDERAYGVAVDDTGVYVVGYERTSDVGDKWRIEKRSITTGALIWSQSYDSSVDDDRAFGVAVDHSGIYIVGVSAYNDWLIQKRNLTDGALIWSQTTSSGPANDFAYGVAVDGSGVYVVGYYNILGFSMWRIEKRRLADGTLIWSQTSVGVTDYNEARDIAVDASGIYVVGWDHAPGNFEWRIEKRNLGLAPAISDMAGLVLLAGQNQSYFIYANPHRMTRAEATYDVASGSIIYGMCLNLQNQGFDTNAEWVSQSESDRGRLLLTGSTILMFGGPCPHWCVSYLEARRLTPIYFQAESLED